MNLNRKLMTLAAVVALSAGAAFSAPQLGGPAARRQARWMQRAGGVAQALNLTEAQKQQAKAIRLKHRDANQPLRAELQQLNQQLRAARQAGNTAEAQRLAALREPVVARVRVSAQAQQAEFRSLLTPEQQTRLDDLRKARHARRQQRLG